MMLNRVSLNTIGLNRIGLNRIGKPSRGSSDRPYIDPEVLASLKAVCICYGKSNDDPDRAIVKNLVDPDNPFVISNAAFKLNSGFGKYSADFESFDWAINISQKQHNKATISLNGRLCNHTAIEIDEMKVNIIGNVTELIYWYIANPDDTTRSEIRLTSGINTLPKSYAKDDGQTYNIGFSYISGDSEITIEQIPSFEGAFVTDGIDDLITSTKTVQEMLGGSNEITVVSMIHQIKESIYNNRAYTNYISGTSGHIRNQVADTKTGIYGYTVTDLNNSSTNIKGSVINNILGDKNDYLYDANTNVELGNAKYSVQNYLKSDGTVSNIGSQLAWYWTIIANKVLTTDQINQVIAYFNLDRTLKPDILCDVKKQGITNENHAEFGDKLIDFSGNGRDIQLNNLAWDGDSGIGKYNYPNWKVKATVANTYSTIVNYPTVNGTYSINVNGVSELMQSIGLHLEIKYTTSTGIIYNDIKQDGVYSYILPDGATDLTLRFGGIPGIVNEPCNITITQIPSHAGALCLDGVNDFGKVTGMPIYKDYTFISKYQRLSYREAIEIEGGAVIASKSYSPNQGAFIFNGVRGDYVHDCYSFGLSSSNNLINDKNLEVYYQTKYTNQGKSISSGSAADSDILWLGTVRDNDTRFINAAIYSLMSFPYSMSEFLIERQLKKHKLGTLYPDMVEFRPVIKKDNRIKNVKYYKLNETADYIDLNIGDYIPVGQRIAIVVDLEEPYEITSITSSSLTDVEIRKAGGQNYAYDILGYVTDKSPQKITMDIQVNSSLVQWNPVVESNVPYKSLRYYNNLQGTGWKQFEVGEYLPIGSVVLTRVNLNNPIDELSGATSSQLKNIQIGRNGVAEYDISGVLTSESPQKINITIDEYIRFEDIVHPYPVLLRFNDENGNEVSWGGKFRVGSTITRIDSIADPESNLLNGLYSVSGLSLNGKAVTSSTSIVEKQMVFKTTATWLLDDNEPKCILSPRLLRIPNSSYKITMRIPDISGHGNHGVIHNSAYIEGSGANEDGSYQFDGVNDFVTIPTLSSGGKQVLMKVNWHGVDDEVLYDQRNSNIQGNYDLAISTYPDTIAYNFRNEGGKTFIDGILNSHIITNNLKNITHNISSINGYNNDNNSTICIGKSVFNGAFAQMALYDFMLFDNISTDDKIKELNEYVGIEAKVELPPYYWDAYGKTNLDEDKNYTANLGTVKDVIEVSQPAIFAENWYDGNPEPVLSSPIINQTDYSIEVKANKMDNNFTMMLDVECDTPLPAFKAKFSMVGTAISVDLKYYINGGSKIIDVFKSGGSTEPVILDIPASERSFIYGTNTDNYPNILIEILPADNGTRYGLTNTNFAYDKMSGYGGYSLGRFDKSWSSSSSNNTSVIVVSRNPYDITLKKLGGNSDWEFNNTELKVISNPVSVKFKSNKNIRVTCDYHYYPVGGNSEGTPLGITSKDLIANKDAIITISPISQENIDKYNIDVNRGYYLIYFQLSSTLAVNEEVTIEMLPLYPNGLVYDGVTDYSENANIPALTDYTYIFKREFLSKTTGSASMYKGEFFANGGMAFIADYAISDGSLYGFSYRGQAKVNSLNTDKIIYGTKTSVNGSSITPNTNIDTAGLTMGKFDSYRKMVFYKLILYPKTIPLLQINFLKNLMEKDEIIDLNNKIFIQE